MRYIGIDYGSKRVGVAFSDELATMGFPHAILQNTPALADMVVVLIKEHSVDAMVMGESKDFHGVENKVAHDARVFSEEISSRTGVHVFFESEIFTTQEARRFPDGKRRADHRAVDAEAAALILTSYLSHHDNN
ncbi:MAG TPA: Holliday junction resolvase RuvX [Candidatus Kaiserbacteria bacterium]|nr:Holliday junction resolvase RuvX [Candidatus Kaiserbacteria bacterium]